MLSLLDKKIIRLLSKDIPLTGRPFKVIADRVGVGEDAIIDCIRQYKKSGLLRKFSAVLNHRKVGFIANAMCVWDVPEKSVVKAGNLIAKFCEVSHCYQRRRALDWNYNLYAMVHGKTKDECIKTAKKISKKIGFSDYKILFSSREFKKTGVRYEEIE